MSVRAPGHGRGRARLLVMARPPASRRKQLWMSRSGLVGLVKGGIQNSEGLPEKGPFGDFLGHRIEGSVRLLRLAQLAVFLGGLGSQGFQAPSTKLCSTSPSASLGFKACVHSESLPRVQPGHHASPHGCRRTWDAPSLSLSLSSLSLSLSLLTHLHYRQRQVECYVDNS